MISANLTPAARKAIYRRDRFTCALCDDNHGLQIHHVMKRSQGGTNSPHNLITLCSDCHALAHGTKLRDWQDVTQEDIEQACCEYLADFYAPGWNPWTANPRPCEQCPRRLCCGWTALDEDCPYDAPPL